MWIQFSDFNVSHHQNRIFVGISVALDQNSDLDREKNPDLSILKSTPEENFPPVDRI